MPIQKQFRLNKVYKISPALLTGRRFVDLISKISSSQSQIFPSNSTTIQVHINYKGQILYGKLIDVLSEIQQIGDDEIFEGASSNITVNLNPIRSFGINARYNPGQINLDSNNLTKEEFDILAKATEEFFPVSEIISQPQNSQVNTSPISADNSMTKDTQVKQQNNSKSVFVIMSFNDDHRDSYFVAIQPTLKKMGFNPIRVDEIQHNNTVTKEIIEAIEGSAFVVADLTGERPNVYYEVGYAHKADKEVVLLAKKGTAVHFDVAAINRIDYKDYTDLCDSLEKRVKAVANRLGIQIEE